MPDLHRVVASSNPSGQSPALAEFPLVSRDHIRHCSYEFWFEKYRTSCIKSRIIQLPVEFVDYLREDGIILAETEDGADPDDDDDDWQPSWASPQPPAGAVEVGHESQTDSESEDESPPRVARLPPNKRFPDLHRWIQEQIQQLGGKVAPKLNWSSPKDATWIMSDKTMACSTADDVYLLLKSSSFISHDLEHAFDGCIPARPSETNPTASPGHELGFNPVLVLRPFFTPQPALEFRCFVKHRNLIGITQRDLKHYPFLEGLRSAIVGRVTELFDGVLRLTFPDGSFVFDVYIPEGDEGQDGLSRARLIDINPWASRTDPLLFEWEELLDLRVPQPLLGTVSESDCRPTGLVSDSDVTDDESGGSEEVLEPVLRLVGKDDPVASTSQSSRYSAHSLPREVVDASIAGERGLRDFAEQWRTFVERGRSTP